MTPAQNAATQWRMVPVEPTPEMVEAGRFPAEDDGPVACYAAMLEAAPKPPETIAQRQAREAMNPGFGFAVQSATAGQSYNAAAPAPATSEGQEGYAAAFYELAALMGLPAMPDSPATVWKRDMLPAIAAALARAGGDGWRPIESAPKDGTWIIAAFYRSGELRGLCHAKWATAAFFADLENGDPCQFCAGWYCPNAEDEICATHWRPMPAAPDAGEDGNV